MHTATSNEDRAARGESADRTCRFRNMEQLSADPSRCGRPKSGLGTPPARPRRRSSSSMARFALAGVRCAIGLRTRSDAIRSSSFASSADLSSAQREALAGGVRDARAATDAGLVRRARITVCCCWTPAPITPLAWPLSSTRGRLDQMTQLAILRKRWPVSLIPAASRRSVLPIGSPQSCRLA
jgi:hypothetical protein